MGTVPALAVSIPESDQAAFYAQMALLEKDEAAGVLLALFLGGFGAHHFYLRRTGLGILYLALCWTGIPFLLGFIECFLMPGRVARYNLAQAALLAQSMRVAGLVPAAGPIALGTGRACPVCATPAPAGVRFCARCGTALA
jgi:TM2 domain-containing membrane protein YozV